MKTRMRQKKFYESKKLKNNVKSEGETLLDMILEYNLGHVRCHLRFWRLRFCYRVCFKVIFVSRGYQVLCISTRKSAQCVLSDGIGGTCRRMEQYTESMLKFMCLVGTAPSAGGARAPLADIMSHMGPEIQKLSTTLLSSTIMWYYPRNVVSTNCRFF